MTDVFISHAHSSAAPSEAIAEALRALGYSVWIDSELPAHRAYSQVIAEQLRLARAVLVLWSDDAAQSHWVLSEANAGREARKLVQLRVDDTVLPMPFDQIHCADLRGWTGDTNAPGWRKVIASISDLIGAVPMGTQHDGAAPSEHGTAKVFSSFPRRRWRSLVVVASLALASLATYLLWRHLVGPDRTVAPTAASAPTAAANDTAAALARFGDRPAIAVLPLETLSADPAQAFLADGLADDLIARLSSWRVFPVIARSSSFHYRGNHLDVKRVGTELGVRYVAEGSVRRAGDRIRISMQLIDAATGANVWNATYDRDIGDLFALQDEIGSTIAASLMGDLTRLEGLRAQQRGTRNLDAWTLFQLGLQRDARNTPSDYLAAGALFERAVARDPRVASAQAILAIHIIYGDSVSDSVRSIAEVRKHARHVATALRIARHAVALDPRDAIAQVALGQAYLSARDLPNALESMRRAVDLNPSMASAWQGYSDANLAAGDTNATLAACRQVRRLDPQGGTPAFADVNAAEAYWMTGRYQPGLEAARRAAAALPEYWFAYEAVATNAVALGRMDEARAAIAQARRVQPNLSLALVQRNSWYARAEVEARRNAALRQAGLQ